MNFTHHIFGQYIELPPEQPSNTSLQHVRNVTAKQLSKRLI
jgi:hypothetical protein